MEINFSSLAIQNPWWSIDKRGKIKKSNVSLGFDPVLYDFAESSIKWQPRILAEVDFSQDHIYFLQGPPGVGKTTAVKLMIRNLITHEKVNSDNVFYYSGSNFYTFEQLNEAIKVFLAWRRPNGTKERLYIFIDEIEFIKNWDKGIKHLWEAGRLKNTTLVIIGAIFNKKPLDKIIINKIITTLDFPEFLNLINPKLAERSPGQYQAFAQQLDFYLDIYFLTGGYPSAINSYKKHGAVSQAIYNNYLSWLMYDMARLGRDIILLKQILEQLLHNFGQPIGYQTIAKKTKAKTHQTIAEYFNILESTFFIKAVYQTESGQRPTSRKAKKLYFYDPFIFCLIYSFEHGSLNYWQFSREQLLESTFHQQLVENIILNHLSQVDLNSENVFYWRDNVKKWQIDFIVKAGRKLTPLLIRYDQPIGELEEKIFRAAGFKQGIIISRNELKFNSPYKIIPLTYFLLFYKSLIK